jgi:hypothetical protein
VLATELAARFDPDGWLVRIRTHRMQHRVIEDRVCKPQRP